jgi:hypothetical protein
MRIEIDFQSFSRAFAKFRELSKFPDNPDREK